jgi:hypothetical protein
MATQYDEKIIISGFHVERYEYLDKYVLKDYERKPRKPKEKNKPQTSKRESSIQRTKQKIKRLVNSNTHLTTFLTLTYGQEVLTPDKSNPIFMKFILRMVYHNKDFQYIAVIEFQNKSKRVHYHLLCNYPLDNFKSEHYKKKFERWFANYYWKNGFIKFKPIYNIENLGSYMCKYLSKDMTDARLFGKKKYFNSKKLNQPQELISYRAYKFIQEHDIDQMEPKFKMQFHHEYIGRVNYSTYKLNQLPFINPFLIKSKNRVKW